LRLLASGVRSFQGQRKKDPLTPKGEKTMKKLIESVKSALTKKINLGQREKEYKNETYFLLNCMKYFTLAGTVVSAYILFLAFGGTDNLFEAFGKAALLDLSIFFFMQMLLRSTGITQVMIVLGFGFVTLLSIYQSMEFQIAKYLNVPMNQIDLKAILTVDAYQWFSAFRQGGFVQVVLFFLGIGQPAFINYLEKKEIADRERAAQKLKNAEAYEKMKLAKIAQGVVFKKRGRPVGWRKPTVTETAN
jgi:hypothetical protein